MTDLPLHQYQEKAIAFSCGLPTSYQALDMGLGKTRIALEWSKTKPCRILVVAPLRAIYSTWPDEIQKWTPEMDYVIMHGPTKSLRPYAKFFIINYEGLEWLYKELFKLYKAKKPLPFAACIIDEGSMIKSHRTKRFKLFKDLRHIFTQGILALGGTPAPNKLIDLWAQIFILDGGKRFGQHFNKYRSEYFESYDRTGRVRVPQSALEAEKMRWRIKSPEHEQRIHSKVSDIMYRLDGADYLNLPDITYNIIPVTIPRSVKDQMRTLTKKSVLELGDHTITVEFAAALGMKLWQMTQGGIYLDEQHNYQKLHEAKLDVLKSLVEEANGQGILCAIQFRFELDMIRKAFPDVPAIVGGTKQEDFMKLLRQWNAGEIPLLLCHPASLSHSVNMQQGSHILLWYSLTRSLEHYLQLNKRLHRQGQQHGVIIHHLVATGTIDEVTYDALVEKKDIQEALLDYLRDITNERDI